MSDPVVVLTGPPGFGKRTQGRILVTRDGFSPRYDLDRRTGRFSREGHDLEGEPLAGAILVCSIAKGGVAAGWAMADLASRDLQPAAMVFETINPVFVQGCVHAGVAIVHRLDPAPTDSLRTGMWGRLDPTVSRLTIESTPAREGSHDAGPG